MNVFEQSEKDFNSLVESVVTLLDNIAAQSPQQEAQECIFRGVSSHDARNLLRDFGNICDTDILLDDAAEMSSLDFSIDGKNEQIAMLESKVSPTSLHEKEQSQQRQNVLSCFSHGLNEVDKSILSFESDDNCSSVPLNPFAPMEGDSESESGDKDLFEGVEEGKKSLSVAGSFPRILYEMLENSEKEGFVGIVSWQHHGKAFRVHIPKQFAASVMSRYFHQTRYTSFQRQLALYGFIRIRAGRDRGAYYHSRFVRDDKNSCISIQRTPIKGAMAQNLTKHKADPNFYSAQSSNDSEQETAYL